MAKNAVHHLPPPKVDTNDMLPRQLTKQEFGRRLMALMLDKGWNQSELARNADIGRDAISTYIRGKSFPEPKNLRRLAKALNCQPEELLPNTVLHAMDSDPSPMMEIRMAQGYPDKAWLRINRMVDVDVAAQVFALLKSQQ